MTDVSANRQSRKYPRKIQLWRILWALAQPLFRLSPRPFWAWRRWLLRGFGACVGPQAHVYPSVRITMPWNLSLGAQSAIGDRAILYALGEITIGDRATVSQGAHLCAGSHDHRRPDRPLITSPIHIGADAWVAADAFVGPGTHIGAGAIVGARAVVMRSVPAGRTVVGNPAQVIDPS
ncbi:MULTISPECIES: acetyltransferase [unclassified Ruegeria]|uniref:acetyltransferase n=1 Tax=unclassified Ruegeria TaxID=2625375 RepID=UPI0014895678|nr:MULTISPECIES: acetyltransferase [unclassified Ruegeria]